MPGGSGEALVGLLADPLLVEALWRSPGLGEAFLVPRHISPAGAVGVNAGGEGSLFIEQQRFGAELLQGALLGKRPELLPWGVRVIAWGLARQDRDGGFPGCGDAFHSTSIFLEGFSRAALVVRAEAPGLWAEVGRSWTDGIGACARWLLRDEAFGPGLERNRPMVHRFWIVAAALESAAAVCGFGLFRSAAQGLADEGVAAQRDDGVNPENGGFDVSYQSAGLLMAGRYAALCAEAGRRARVVRGIERGMEWLLAREEKPGELSRDGSTRVGRERHRTGKVKGINHWELLQAAVFAARLSGRDEFFAFARRVAGRSGGVTPIELL